MTVARSVRQGIDVHSDARGLLHGVLAFSIADAFIRGGFATICARLTQRNKINGDHD